jgi:hypothetical protein
MKKLTIIYCSLCTFCFRPMISSLYGTSPPHRDWVGGLDYGFKLVVGFAWEETRGRGGYVFST